MYASARAGFSFHSALPFGSTQGPLRKANAPIALDRASRFFVDGPQSRVRSEKYGGKDGQILPHRSPSPESCFSLDQFQEFLFGGRDNGFAAASSDRQGYAHAGDGGRFRKLSFQHDQAGWTQHTWSVGQQLTESNLFGFCGKCATHTERIRRARAAKGLGTLCGTSTRNHLHLGAPCPPRAASRLPRLNADEYFQSLSRKQFSFVHSGIGLRQALR